MINKSDSICIGCKYVTSFPDEQCYMFKEKPDLCLVNDSQKTKDTRKKIFTLLRDSLK